MSSYDDDEALFEDLYDDDNIESKPTLTEASAGDSSSQANGAPESSSASAGVAASASASADVDVDTAAGQPPAAPSAANGSGAAEGNPDALQPDLANADVNNAALPGTPNSMGTPQPPAGMDPQQAAQFMQMTPEMQLQFQQFQQFQQQQQAMFQQGGGAPPGSLPVMPPMPHDAGASSMPPSNLGKESGKMFIGGLNWDTTEQGLVDYFSKFGEVLDHTIMRDASSGRSRGFGFLTFKDPSSVDKVIAESHVLDGKLIDPKRAIAREEQDKVGKIFVGGIDPMVTEREFNEFFSQFGSIIDAQLMIDKDTGRSRGFGFITYDTPEAVDRVTVNKYLTLKGKAMEVKRAEPRGQHQQNQMQQQQAQQQYAAYAGAGGYGGNYAQGAYQQGMAAYGQNMTPEMQAYWQRMQQWYMYQQAAAAAGQQGQQGLPQLPLQSSGSAEGGAPLNPQQQAVGHSDSDGISKDRKGGGDGRRGGNGNGNGDGNNRDSQDLAKRLNLPKGPRRAPPTGPSGGSRGRGGYYNRSKGFHPYSRGGRRNQN